MLHAFDISKLVFLSKPTFTYFKCQGNPHILQHQGPML